jgi:hypothetical protein
MIIFKNFFSFGLTFKAYDWLIQNQTKATPVFNALGSVQLVICLSSIPMCKLLPRICFLTWHIPDEWHIDIYGKRLRSYFYRHDLLAMFGVR